MLTWDLSDSLLARSDEPLPAPGDAEFFVLLVALLINEGIAYSQLARSPIQLSQHNCEQVAEIIEWILSALSPDIGQGESLRQRLKQLVGLKVALLSPSTDFPARSRSPTWGSA